MSPMLRPLPSPESAEAIRANLRRTFEHERQVRGAVGPFDLGVSKQEAAPSINGEGGGRVWESRSGGIGFTLFEIRSAGGVAVLPPSGADHIAFCCVLRGSFTLRIGDSQSLLPTRQPVAASHDKPAIVEAASPGWGIRVEAPIELLRERGRNMSLKQHGGGSGRRSDGTNCAGLSPLADCLECAGRAMRLGTSVPQEVEANLVAALDHASSDSLRGRREHSKGTVPECVSAAERYIRANLGQSVNMDDLVRTTGASLRTLHASFRKHRGYSPMRYLREQRMEQVRRELAERVSGESVTSAALKWGFAHLGRFAAYYTRQFGENPSITLQNARALRRSGTFAD